MKKRHIILLPYDESWPREFEKIKRALCSGLGPLALGVEHVGSTAVTGLWAKPIIDIDIIIPSGGNFDAVRRGLSAILYVCRQDSTERHIAFRDYLRANKEDAHEYVRVKREGMLHPFDIGGYIAHKSAFIEAVYKKAGL